MKSLGLTAYLVLTAIAGPVADARAQVVAAGIGQPPPRDPRAAPQTGTAAIKGRVVDAQTSTPVARALVRLIGPADSRAVVTTDASGVFAFTALPAGAYSLSIGKSTYLQTQFPEPGRTLRSRYQPLRLADGETVDAVTVRLYRGGVMTGRVVDVHGEPVEYADVRAMRLPTTGVGRASLVGSTSPNDLGEFRLPRLQPGNYVVLVMPRRMTPDDRFEAQPVPAYYPGVAALDQAQVIPVERGATVAGIDVMLVEATSTLVSGVMVAADGQPLRGGGAFINVRRVFKDMPFAGETSGTALKPDGTFELRLAPGEYELEAQYRPPAVDGPLRPEDQQFANLRIAVSGQAITGLVLAAGRGAGVTGRFVFEGTAAPPANLVQARVSFSGPSGPGCRSGRSETAADGTFTIEGLSGSCIARVNGSFTPWTLKAVMHDRRNLLDEPVTFSAGQQLRDVQVIFTDRRTELVLTVADEDGRITREYVAMIFPVDESKWSAESSRYVRAFVPPVAAPGSPPPGSRPGEATTSSAPLGATSNPPAPRRDLVAGLPAGDYSVVALDDLEADVPRDAALFERLHSSAQRVTLTEGVTTALSLRRVTLASR